MFHTKTGLLFFSIYCIYKEREFIQDGDNFDLTYYSFFDFLGDERGLLNAILFRQIHTLQDLPGIVVFRGHVYGIEYMFRMLKISVDVYDLPLNRLHHTFLTPVVWSGKLTTCDQRHLTLISWKIRCRQIDKTHTLLKSHISYYKTIIYIHI